jgi:hypothetical protein
VSGKCKIIVKSYDDFDAFLFEMVPARAAYLSENFKRADHENKAIFITG